jgi:hypothetical protein
MDSKHLEDINQSYCAHMCDALCYSAKSLQASIVFFIHAFCPDTFVKTGSEIIQNMNEEFIKKYSKKKY